MKKLNNILYISIILFFFISLSCKDSSTIGPGTTGSDLTRTGKFISFTSNKAGDYDIWIAQVNSSGVLETTNLVYPSNPYNLTSRPGLTETDKQSNWSPDGRVLVFSKSYGNLQEIYAFFFKADGMIDSTISPNPKNLFSSGGNWDNNPSFSPNGMYLVFDRRYDNNSPAGVDTADSRDIYIGDVTGSGSTFSVGNIRPWKTTSGLDEYNPKWSPKISVRRVAYEYATSATSEDHDVYIMDPLDTTYNVNYYNPGRSGYPAWEPTCTKMIFESDQGNSGVYKIVSAPYPTSGTPSDLVQSNIDNNRYPTWLPNGGMISYINIPTSGIGNIFVIKTTGGIPSKLLNASFDNFNNLYPAW